MGKETTATRIRKKQRESGAKGLGRERRREEEKTKDNRERWKTIGERDLEFREKQRSKATVYREYYYYPTTTTLLCSECDRWSGRSVQ